MTRPNSPHPLHPVHQTCYSKICALIHTWKIKHLFLKIWQFLTCTLSSLVSGFTERSLSNFPNAEFIFGTESMRTTYMTTRGISILSSPQCKRSVPKGTTGTSSLIIFPFPFPLAADFPLAPGVAADAWQPDWSLSTGRSVVNWEVFGLGKYEIKLQN